MIDLVRGFLPYWWSLPLAAGAFWVYTKFGWRGLLAVVTLGVAGGLYTKGRTDERDQMEQDAQRARSEAIEVRNDVDDQVAKDGPDAARDDLRNRVNRMHDDKPR